MDNVVVRQRQATFKGVDERRTVLYMWICSYCGKSFKKDSSTGELTEMVADNPRRQIIRGGEGGRQTYL